MQDHQLSVSLTPQVRGEVQSHLSQECCVCFTALMGSDCESRPLTSPNQGLIHLFPPDGKDCDISGVLEDTSQQACILDDFFLVGKVRGAGTHFGLVVQCLPSPSRKNTKVSSTRSQTAALLGDTRTVVRHLP